MLGLGRAIGETIAVTIVIGNAAVIGNTIFSQGYTLAAVIANEFGEAASDPIHRAALIAAGLVLFVLTLIVNAIARYYVNRAGRGPRTRPEGDGGMSAVARRACGRSAPAAAAPTRSRAASSLAFTLVAIVPLVLILYWLIKEGLGAWSVDFFTTDPTGRFLGDPGGIRSAILGTIEMVALASVIAVPARRRRRALPRRVRQGRRASRTSSGTSST